MHPLRSTYHPSPSPPPFSPTNCVCTWPLARETLARDFHNSSPGLDAQFIARAFPWRTRFECECCCTDFGFARVCVCARTKPRGNLKMIVQGECHATSRLPLQPSQTWAHVCCVCVCVCANKSIYMWRCMCAHWLEVGDTWSWSSPHTLWGLEFHHRMRKVYVGGFAGFSSQSDRDFEEDIERGVMGFGSLMMTKGSIRRGSLWLFAFLISYYKDLIHYNDYNLQNRHWGLSINHVNTLDGIRICSLGQYI